MKEWEKLSWQRKKKKDDLARISRARTFTQLGCRSCGDRVYSAATRDVRRLGSADDALTSVHYGASCGMDVCVFWKRGRAVVVTIAAVWRARTGGDIIPTIFVKRALFFSWEKTVFLSVTHLWHAVGDHEPLFAPFDIRGNGQRRLSAAIPFERACRARDSSLNLPADRREETENETGGCASRRIGDIFITVSIYLVLLLTASRHSRRTDPSHSLFQGGVSCVNHLLLRYQSNLIV